MGFRYRHFVKLDTTELAQKRVPLRGVCLRKVVTTKNITHRNYRDFTKYVFVDFHRHSSFRQTNSLAIYKQLSALAVQNNFMREVNNDASPTNVTPPVTHLPVFKVVNLFYS